MSRGVLGSNLNGPHVIKGYLAALYYRNFLEKWITSVLKGYASCNTRTNVATTWWTASAFWL